MEIQKLLDISEPVSRHEMMDSKYLWMAVEFGLENYRILRVGKFLKALGDGESFPKPVVDMMHSEGRCLCVFNMVCGRPVQVYMRSITGKSFVSQSECRSFPYGIGMLGKDFRFGLPIVICEGVADRDALAQAYPFVIAMTNKRLNPFQFFCLRSLTDKAILAYDCDATGQKSFYHDSKILSDSGIANLLLKHSRKDAGDIIEYAMKGDMDRYSHEISRYRAEIGVLCRKF